MFFRATVSKTIVPTTSPTMDNKKSSNQTMQPNTTSKPSPKKSSPPGHPWTEQPLQPIFSHAPVAASEKKSLLVTYILWLFGGIFGVHHLYLRRDRQAFVWWSTLGGYFGVGWLHDAITIPALVREANLDPRFQNEFNQKLFKERKPSFSTTRFLSAVVISYLWGQVAMMALPEDEVNGVNLLHLHWILPLFIALGVWTVGNIGREKGGLKACLITAYLVYPMRYWVYDETYWFLGTVIASALAFDYFSKEWDLSVPKKKSKKARAVPLVLAVLVYMALLSSYFYFNGMVADADGNEVPLKEAVQNFLNSPWWTDLKDTWNETIRFAQHNGWAETWKQIVDQLDVGGEQNAYKVLGLSMTATQAEVKARYRKLSLENHPDKIKDDSVRKEAEQRFMEIQQAYETLSKQKSKRRQKNREYKDEM